jgi:hypothetical protein
MPTFGQVALELVNTTALERSRPRGGRYAYRSVEHFPPPVAYCVGHKEVPVTQLRKQMLEELQRRNYSQTTVNSYLKIVEAFAKQF